MHFDNDMLCFGVRPKPKRLGPKATKSSKGESPAWGLAGPCGHTGVCDILLAVSSVTSDCFLKDHVKRSGLVEVGGGNLKSRSGDLGSCLDLC